MGEIKDSKREYGRGVTAENESKGKETEWKIATWNVRGLAGKEQELVQEFEEEKLDMMGITETKKKGQGEVEMGEGHLLIYSGVDEGTRAKGGVGCIICREHKKFIKSWEAITERILKVEMSLRQNTTLIIVYGPNEDARVAEKDEFWEKMNETVENAKDRIVIIGDLNGRVGKKDEQSGDVIGTYGEKERNKNGERLINFCIANELIVTNTFYQHKELHKYTREVKSRNEKSIIDYVLVNKRYRRDVKDVRVMRNAEIYSDHFLLRARIKKTEKNEKRGTRGEENERKIRKQIRSYKLRDREVAKRFREKTEREIEAVRESAQSKSAQELWCELKTVILGGQRRYAGVLGQVETKR